ncbi:MAG: hypothetical protein SVX43_18880 [Cyanobacteriota bacterium]|nr:hypothetical protein [Cyanobacteriota bacterium]
MNRSGRWYATGKYSYTALFYCCKPQTKMISIQQYARENLLTVKQCKRLLKKKLLVGHRYKGRMYVAENVR